MIGSSLTQEESENQQAMTVYEAKGQRWLKEKEMSSSTQNERTVLQTKRLLLRALSAEDLADFHEIMSDPDVVRFEPYSPMTLGESERELGSRAGNPEFIGIVDSESGKLIGNIYLGRRDYSALELGFLLGSRYWGKGFAREACEALIPESFSRGVHRIYAECDPENTASWRLLERLSFKRVAHLTRNVYFRTDTDGRPVWKDTYIYSLLNGNG